MSIPESHEVARKIVNLFGFDLNEVVGLSVYHDGYCMVVEIVCVLDRARPHDRTITSVELLVDAAPRAFYRIEVDEDEAREVLAAFNYDAEYELRELVRHHEGRIRVAVGELEKVSNALIKHFSYTTGIDGSSDAELYFTYGFDEDLNPWERAVLALCTLDKPWTAVVE